MKKLFTLIMAFACVGILSVSGQVCEPDTTLTESGLFPDAAGLPCVVQGVPYDTVILIKNFDMVEVGGNVVTVNWVRIDSIKGLPAGITYECDNPTCYWENLESGCIRLSGTSNDDCGQYKLGIFVCADVGLQLCDVPISTFGLRFDLRVIEPDSPCFEIDTLNCLPDDLDVFGTCPCVATGISDLGGIIEDIGISPNPFKGQAMVNFVSTRSGTYTASVVNQLGQAVRVDQINVNPGQNSFPLSSKGMAAGIYFFQIQSEKGTLSKKFVIAD